MKDRKYRRTLLALTSLALVVGALLGAMLSYGSQFPGLWSTSPRVNEQNLAAIRAAVNPDAAPGIEAFAELEERMQHEISARRRLEQKVDALNRRIVALNQVQPEPPVPASLDTPGDADETTVPAGPGQDWFNQQALIESGLDQLQASQLKAHFEELEMERLLLRNQSIREGWNREQLRAAMQVVASKEDELKIQLGEDAYDAYLYAAGKPNRVAVTSVLERAPAGEAGILPGDHIVRYDNQRIYDWFDLRAATAGGTIGEMVSLEIERDGQTLQFYLSRGPLGIRMDSISIAPDPG